MDCYNASLCCPIHYPLYTTLLVKIKTSADGPHSKCIIVCKLLLVMNTAKIKEIYVLSVVMADLCNITQSLHVLENISMVYSKKLYTTDIGER